MVKQYKQLVPSSIQSLDSPALLVSLFLVGSAFAELTPAPSLLIVQVQPHFIKLTI